MSMQNIQKLFNFTMKALTSAEIMPKRAAAHFWVSVPLFSSQLV